MQLGGPLLCALNWETVVFWCPTYQQSWQLPTVHQKQMFQRCNKNASLKVQILVWVDQKKDVRCINCYTESCRSAFPFIQSTARINSPNFCRPRLTAKRRAFKFVFIWKYSIFLFRNRMIGMPTVNYTFFAFSCMSCSFVFSVEKYGGCSFFSLNT